MIAREIAYSEIENLVTKFKSMPAQRRKGMNEMQTRLGYILPMFKALGWDTSNIDEVSPEEKVSRGWVDFSFRIDNIPRFFLETKRVKEDLNDKRWVTQAIDYAWTKSVTWALLSDFEGLRVFNAEWRESNPFTAQFFELDLDSYLTNFDQLWWLSKSATLQRTLDLEAEKVGKKIKRLPVSQHLFRDLKRWRENLFKNYQAFNLEYSSTQVDDAVLRLLNRLIFIRTAEDRKVEDVLLLSLVRELKGTREFNHLDRKLAALFRRLDERYNSQLFAPHFSEELIIPPTDLEAVIEGLYERDLIFYNFNALDADVLGTVYEQYLGHVIAEREGESPAQEKHAKRKSQGIYYTPAFVTKYVVQQTIGAHLNENGYQPSNPLRVLDLACGSGSFLIEAFDFIDDFVARQRGHSQRVELNSQNRARQHEVLQNSIFGVDKDKQAVEVARLNLLLRALHSHAKLPMLDHIVNDDSLQPGIFEDHFLGVMEEGGFDVIIGNPPYVRAENMPREERDRYMAGGFETVYGRFDLFILFLERAIKLLKEGGRLGFIVPYSILNENYSKLLRAFILNSCAIESIVDTSKYKVFQQASVATAILILRKESNLAIRQSNPIKIIQQDSYDDGIRHEETGNFIKQIVFNKTPLNSFRLDFDNKTISVLDKVDRQSIKVADLCYVITGAVLHNPETGESKERLIHQKAKSGDKPYIEAKEIARYRPPINKRFLEYRAWEMHRPKFPELFENNKIMVQMVAGSNGLIATYDDQNLYTDHSLHLCVLKHKLFGVKRSQIKISEDEARLAQEYDPRFLLAHVNSRLSNFYFRRKLEGGLNIYPETVRQLPIRHIDFGNIAEKAAHDEIVQLVQKMLTLQNEHQLVRPEDNLDLVRSLDRQISQVDQEIDRRVYRLYGLTDAEIQLVEEV
jgi:type I restriction-modification system DNA methylase subunit